MKSCDELIEGLEQPTFIKEQEIMSVKIKDTSTAKTFFNKANDYGRNILKGQPAQCHLIPEGPSIWTFICF